MEHATEWEMREEPFAAEPDEDDDEEEDEEATDEGEIMVMLAGAQED
jgi:hypothetical protein